MLLHKPGVLSVNCLHVISFCYNVDVCVFAKTNSSFSPCPKNLRSIGPYNFKNPPKVTQVCFSLLTYYLIWYITLMMIFIVRIVQLRPFSEMPLWLLLLYMFLQHVSLFWPLWVSFYDYFEVVFTYRYSTDLSYLCINSIFKTIR